VWTRSILSAGIVLVGAGAILGALAVILEDRLIYFPSRALEAAPSDFGIAAEELSPVASDGTRLHGWHLRGTGERALLFFHGNAGNISHRLERAGHIVAAHGLDIFLVDYRGYGRSEGRPSEEGLYADGLAVYDLARDRGFPPERIVLLGESLGASVAVEVASRRPSGALILEMPFRSIPAMARHHYPIVPRGLISTRFDNEAKVPSLSVPTLFVAADRDAVVPPDHVRTLFEKHPGPKQLFVLRDAGHDGAYVAGPEYDAAWKSFLGSGL
jgi:pimeloyl-ACP methyl ester carboxylesterase